MTRFQINDLVRVTDDPIYDADYTDGCAIQKGKIYRVTGRRDSVDGDTLSLDCRGGDEWDESRFELVYRPGDYESWKPKVGNPVKCDFKNSSIDATEGRFYSVVEGYSMAGHVWISTDTRNMHSSPDRWIAVYGMTPVASAEAEKGEPRVEETKTEEPVILVSEEEVEDELSSLLAKLQAEIEALRVESDRKGRSLVAAQAELRNFRETVRDAVIREAEGRGWCSAVDDWLEELGLERRDSTYGMPSTHGSVISLNGGGIAILKDTDSVPWQEYDSGLNSIGWRSFYDLKDRFNGMLFEGPGE